MNFDLILAVIFYAAIFIFYSTHKQKFTRQGLLILYKTKLGIFLMNKLSKKYPKLLNFLSYVSIFIGFIGMIFILYTLIQGGIKLILSYLQIIPETQPVLAPVLPGISVQGLPCVPLRPTRILLLRIQKSFLSYQADQEPDPPKS